jgi:hypothetical protein
LQPNRRYNNLDTLSLEARCTSLGLTFERFLWPGYPDQADDDRSVLQEPTQAIQALYTSQGYRGTCFSGAGPLMLMKCACLDELVFQNTFLDDTDAYLRYFEALATIHKPLHPLLVHTIASATPSKIAWYFDQVRSLPAYEALYPDMDAEGLLAPWRALGPQGWARIAEVFFRDPYRYRSGWPTLALAKDQDLRLVAVKTGGRFTSQQVRTMEDLLLPLGLNISVVSLERPGDSEIHAN